MMRKLIVILSNLWVLNTLTIPLHSNDIDSLLFLLENSTHDTSKMNLLQELAEEYQNVNRDSAMKFGNQALDLANKLSHKRGQSDAHFILGLINYFQANYNKASENWEEALRIHEELNDKKGISKFAHNLGAIHYMQGNYDKAIENFIKALKVYEEFADSSGISGCLNNIGAIHQEQKNYHEALEYYTRSLEISKLKNEKQTVSNNYNNIGNVYYHLKKYDIALEFYLKSSKLYEELENSKGLALSFNNVANCYASKAIYDQAIVYYKKSLEYREETGDTRGMALVHTNISKLHILKAEQSTPPNKVQLDLAIFHGKKSFDLAKELTAVPIQNDAANRLKKAYMLLGRYKDAIQYADIYILTQDSMFNNEKTKALAEMESKYQTEKKQLQIENLEKQKELDEKTIEAQKAENRKQQIIIIFSITGFLIVLSFSVIVFRMFRQKRKDNILLAMQKQHIEEQKKEIDDSINYARRIQTALLPADQYAEKILNDHFIIFRPHSVVSGDFYWARNVQDWLIVTVADCTGHGVPGAFMSMLGVSFLNEIVGKKEEVLAANILNNLRSSVIESLRQTGEEGTQKDGMDMSLAAINTKNRKCYWAGASNPLWIIKNHSAPEKFEEKAEMIHAIKGDSMPVAVHVKMDPFTNHEIQLEKGDKIYLFSDGFPDQFGGPKGKKYKYKAFKRLIAETSNLPIKEQGKQIENVIDQWMNGHDQKYTQIDDITILGLQV